MARQPRFVLPGYPQHIIQRGNNRAPIFCSDYDYIFFLDKLKETTERYACEIHAYVLMTNHIHLLVTPLKEDSISKTMQGLGRRYVQYFNYNYQRTGTLWEGRYKATIIDTDSYLFTCMRYIELNPVRAGMVLHPSDYQWSSHTHNAIGKINNVITLHNEYKNLGNSPQEQQNAYKALFNFDIDERTLNEIRHASNKCWGLGGNIFKEKIQPLVSRRLDPKSRGGDRRSNSFRINRV